LTDVLQCLKKYGERLDSEIAVETGVPLESVHQLMGSFARSGAVISCSVTRFRDGQPIESQLYRVSGYVPPAAPGRKPGPKV